MSFWDSNALISNPQSELLFYTNGAYIANVNNDTMMNGSGLNPSTYTYQNQDGLSIPQADIIIPFPDDSIKYYLFHITIDSAGYIPLYLYYSIVDMNLDGGLGGVVSKNNILAHQPLSFGGLTACKHANGRDWWLICHEYAYDYDDDTYLKYLITPDGISGPYTQAIGKLRIRGVGQNVFSLNGNKFANYDGEDDLDIMDFDRCSGIFSNCIHVAIDDTAFTTGSAFSPNSKVLYLSSTNYIYQFDLTDADIPASKATVAVYDGFYSHHPLLKTTFYLTQLMSDGKIYVVTGNGTDYLHVINNPDSIGLGCNVCQHCLHLPQDNHFTIPNYPNYFLGADTTSSLCDTLRLNFRDVDDIVKPEINLFPNPTTHILYATSNEKQKFRKVKVFNALGQEQTVNYSFIKNNEHLEVNTSALLQGVYFLELFSEKEKIVRRFVKE